MADISEADLWGLRPDAPPPLMPGNGQGNGQAVPTTPPPPLAPNISEGQRWGTEALPGQTRPAPPALNTGPPPVPAGPLTDQSVEDAREFDRSKAEEVDAYTKNRLSIIDFKPLPDAFTPDQHPEWQKLQTAREMLQTVPNAKERRELGTMITQMEKRINSEVRSRADQANRARREQLARSDAPYQSVEARTKTADEMSRHVGTTIDKIAANVTSNNPADARQADFDVNVSPIMTLSKPLPGKEKEKPNGTNRDYTPLRDVSTDIAVHNRKLPPDAAARYALIIGTPGGGTDDKGNQLPGYNGRKGMGAANYKVIGRDDLDNVIVEVNDGTRLRIPGDSYRRLLVARQQGAQRARQWEADFKKSQEPGLIRRAVNWGLSVIPEKGF